ncbi:MAG: lytic transglycosylase domain-containing protein [Bacteroidales bacterium]
MILTKTYCAAILLFAVSFSFTQAAERDTAAVNSGIDPFEFAPVISPQMPASLTFCGDTISLKRYDMRERFDREIMTMSYMHSSTLQLIKKANRLFPVIDPILKQMGIPEDMKYLAVIESNLNLRALSPAKAVGLWQLMPFTARQYGLEVGDSIDERYHPELSTLAACRMLKDLYSHFHNWSSVAAAYNIGPGRISTELKNQGVKTSFDLWLVEETSRYVFRILAAKELFSHPRKYGFVIKSNQLYKPIRCNNVVVNSPIEDLYQFARDNQTSYYLLKDFNAWLRSKSIPNSTGKLYYIKIPMKEDLNYENESVVPYSKEWVTQ